MLNLALLKMQLENYSNEEILRDLINEDQKSDIKKKMQEGTDYYNNEPDILDTDFRLYHVDGVPYTDYSKSNRYITNNFHKLLVDQKASYIVGNAVVLEVINKKLADNEEDDSLDRVNDLLGEQFEDILNDWVIGTSNKGMEAVFVYVDEKGQFQYEIVPSEEIIPIYATRHQRKLEQVIRYYEVQVYRKDSKTPDTKIAAEWWTANDVTYYIQNDENNFVLDVNYDPNPAPHFSRYNTTNTNARMGASWGQVPFIILENNSKKTTDLEPIKRYIDAYDAVSSGFLHDLEDIQTAIWVLKGYEGTDLSEFMQNLKKFKAIKVNAEEHAGAESDRLEIPVEARKVLLDLLDNKIYSIGQGVDLNKLVANTSGVALKILFTGLDMKANTLIRKLKNSLESLLWFSCEYLRLADKTAYDYLDYGFVINKSVIYNIQEQCQNIVMMSPFMSLETAVANNPFVGDAKAEIEQMEKEKEKAVDQYGGSVGRERPEEDEEGEDNEEDSDAESEDKEK